MSIFTWILGRWTLEKGPVKTLKRRAISIDLGREMAAFRAVIPAAVEAQDAEHQHHNTTIPAAIPAGITAAIPADLTAAIPAGISAGIPVVIPAGFPAGMTTFERPAWDRLGRIIPPGIPVRFPTALTSTFRHAFRQQYRHCMPSTRGGDRRLEPAI